MLHNSQETIASLAKSLGNLLADKKAFISTAESCTGGAIAEAITSVAGSSKWFDRGYVTYSNKAKRQMLSVRVNTLKKFGAVSERTVEEMAKAAIKKSGATFSIAVSGVAGPEGGTAEKPVGTVWFAWAVNNEIETLSMKFPGDREAVRRGAVIMALQGLIVRIRRWD